MQAGGVWVTGRAGRERKEGCGSAPLTTWPPRPLGRRPNQAENQGTPPAFPAPPCTAQAQGPLALDSLCNLLGSGGLGPCLA